MKEKKKKNYFVVVFVGYRWEKDLEDQTYVIIDVSTNIRLSSKDQTYHKLQNFVNIKSQTAYKWHIMNFKRLYRQYATHLFVL